MFDFFILLQISIKTRPSGPPLLSIVIKRYVLTNFTYWQIPISLNESFQTEHTVPGEPLNTPGLHDPPPCQLSEKDASEGSEPDAYASLHLKS